MKRTNWNEMETYLFGFFVKLVKVRFKTVVLDSGSSLSSVVVYIHSFVLLSLLSVSWVVPQTAETSSSTDLNQWDFVQRSLDQRQVNLLHPAPPVYRMSIRRRLFNFIIPTCNLLQGLIKIFLRLSSRISNFIKLGIDFFELKLCFIELLLELV